MSYFHLGAEADTLTAPEPKGLRTITTVVDEPNRLIELAEAAVNERGLRLYKYYARRNGGDWLPLQGIGNRIPSGW